VNSFSLVLYHSICGSFIDSSLIASNPDNYD
jgi:hypothetical protein